MPIRFIYCTIPLLLHYYVDRRMHCATDLHHTSSTPLNPQSIAETSIWCFAVVNQYDSKTVSQQTSASLKQCYFLSVWNGILCYQLLSITAFANHWFGAFANKRWSLCLKSHFPIGVRWILATIGTYWHRIDAIVCISGKWKSVFRSLCPQIRFGLITDLIPVLLLGSLGIGKRCFEIRNNSTNSNPFAGGFLISREISKVSFE